MFLLDEFFADIDYRIEGRLVTGNIFFECLVFGDQKMNGSQIVTNISSWQYLLLFFDPVLFICHIPVELPQFAAFFQASTAFHGQFHQFGVSILIESALKSCPNQIICGRWVPRVVGRDQR